MKKIIFGLLFSIMAFQVNAATQTIDGSGIAAFLAGPVQAGEAFSESDVLVLASGFTYVINLAGTDLPVGSVTGFDIQINGTTFLTTPVTLSAGTYDVAYFGTATLPNSLLSFTVNAVGTPVSSVPVPAAAWLFGSALMGMVGVSRRKSASVAA